MPYDKARQDRYNLKTARNHGFETYSEYCVSRRASRDPNKPKRARPRYANDAERIAGHNASLERMALRKGYASFADYNRGKSKEYQRKIWAELRAEMFAAYGRACTCCGESHAEFLTLEHGDVRPVTKRNGRRAGPVRQYRQAKALGWPRWMTVLCMNCNWSQRHGRLCPHKLDV